MKVQICLEKQELQGNKMVAFEVCDGAGVNIGTFLVGKGGIRWQQPKASKKARAKSWSEVIRWLQEHGRTVTR
jgi:hypothetical protein